MGNLLNALRGGRMGGDEFRVLNVPRCRIARVAPGAIPNSTASKITFDTGPPTAGYYDTDSLYSSAVPTRVTANTPALYGFWASAVFANDTPGSFRSLYFIKNNVAAELGRVNPMGSAGGGGYMATSWPISLNQGDYVELYCVQDSGGSLNIVAAEMVVCFLSTIG